MKLRFLFAMLAIAMMPLLNSCGGDQAATNSENTDTELHAEAEYACPMKCEGDKTYTSPGQCPVCKMDLEEVDSGEETMEHNDTEDHSGHGH